MSERKQILFPGDFNSKKKVLCNEHWGAADSIKHCEKRLPLK